MSRGGMEQVGEGEGDLLVQCPRLGTSLMPTGPGAPCGGAQAGAGPWVCCRAGDAHIWLLVTPVLLPPRVLLVSLVLLEELVPLAPP